jgi:hypothetical protein
MFKKITVTGATVLCIGLVAAGCGGDDETTTTAAATTKSEFIEQGDAILCTKGEEVADATASIDLQTASRQELKDFVFEGVLPAAQKAYDGLSSLEAPPGDEDEITAFLAELQSAIETTEADPAQLITGPDPFAKADKLILEYGLSDCPA